MDQLSAASSSAGRAETLSEQQASKLLTRRLTQRIGEQGPIPVSEYLLTCLYEPEAGFYMRSGGGRPGGRSGHFLTAPEVGPLFGEVLARALDSWWSELGEPDPFTVIDWGAGPGTLARSLLAAEPACAATGALQLVLVELSPAQRALHPAAPDPPSQSSSPQSSSPPPPPPSSSSTQSRLLSSPEPRPLVVSVSTVAEALPRGVSAGVVLANELLDNLPFDVVRRASHGWEELRVNVQDRHNRFALVAVPAAEELVAGLPEMEVGALVPVQRAARRWVAEAHRLLGTGRIVAFDYGSTTSVLAQRSNPLTISAEPLSQTAKRQTAKQESSSPPLQLSNPLTDVACNWGWLRTHRLHQSTASWLSNPGLCDITSDVAFDQVQADHQAAVCTQAEFLRAHGVDELADEGRTVWSERAAVGDLKALKARSRVREAEALTDPKGLGAFTALTWTV